MMSLRRDVAARRAGGLLLAVLLVASQASAWSHAVAIAHVACLEHGEAIHRRVLPAEDARPVRAGDAATVSSDLAAATGHDHCASAAVLRWRDVALTAPAALAAFAPVAQSATFGAMPRGTSPSVVYRLAPKTSPPASA